MKDKFKETLSNIFSYLLKVERRTLLWTNPSNIYGAGTVALDLSDYDEVEILAAGFQTSNYVYSRCPVGKDGLIQAFTTSPDNASNAYTFMNSASRHYTVNSTGITFNNGQMTYAGSAYQNWNSRAVPLKIYGIKSGGVLRNSVIAVLSAILKIGGGVDEGDSQGTAVETHEHKAKQRVGTDRFLNRSEQRCVYRPYDTRLYRDLYQRWNIWWCVDSYISLANGCRMGRPLWRRERLASWCGYLFNKYEGTLWTNRFSELSGINDILSFCSLTLSERGCVA